MPEDVGKRLLRSPKVGLTYSAPSRSRLGWALASESSCGSKYPWQTDDTVRPRMIGTSSGQSKPFPTCPVQAEVPEPLLNNRRISPGRMHIKHFVKLRVLRRFRF